MDLLTVESKTSLNLVANKLIDGGKKKIDELRDDKIDVIEKLDSKNRTKLANSAAAVIENLKQNIKMQNQILLKQSQQQKSINRDPASVIEDSDKKFYNDFYKLLYYDAQFENQFTKNIQSMKLTIT